MQQGCKQSTLMEKCLDTIHPSAVEDAIDKPMREIRGSWQVPLSERIGPIALIEILVSYYLHFQKAWLPGSPDLPREHAVGTVFRFLESCDMRVWTNVDNTVDANDRVNELLDLMTGREMALATEQYIRHHFGNAGDVMVFESMADIVENYIERYGHYLTFEIHEHTALMLMLPDRLLQAHLGVVECYRRDHLFRLRLPTREALARRGLSDD